MHPSRSSATLHNRPGHDRSPLALPALGGIGSSGDWFDAPVLRHLRHAGPPCGRWEPQRWYWLHYRSVARGIGVLLISFRSTWVCLRDYAFVRTAPPVPLLHYSTGPDIHAAPLPFLRSSWDCYREWHLRRLLLLYIGYTTLLTGVTTGPPGPYGATRGRKLHLLPCILRRHNLQMVKVDAGDHWGLVSGMASRS